MVTVQVSTTIHEDGAVTVTVDDGSDDDETPPFSTLALEALARQSATTALTTWLSLRAADE